MCSNTSNLDFIAASAHGAVKVKDHLAWICKVTWRQMFGETSEKVLKLVGDGLLTGMCIYSYGLPAHLTRSQLQLAYLKGQVIGNSTYPEV